MSNLSVRCQRLSSLSSHRLNISEVLEVMQEHDLMDLLRAKTDGDLDQVSNDVRRRGEIYIYYLFILSHLL